MITISLPGYPEKTLSIDGRQPARWDLDVWNRIGGFRVRDAELSREGLSLEDALDIIFEHDSGSADELLHALGVPAATIKAAWNRHLQRHPPIRRQREYTA